MQNYGNAGEAAWNGAEVAPGDGSEPSNATVARPLPGSGEGILLSKPPTDICGAQEPAELTPEDFKNMATGRMGGSKNSKIGSEIIDEHSQISAQLLHADAYTTSLARASIFKLARP